jgi:hypothetical protein
VNKASLARWENYFALRDQNLAVDQAARRSKIDPHTAWRFERGEPGSQGLQAAAELGVTRVGGLEVAPDPPLEAKAALEDFALFRRRYFGRVSTPWQEDAAYKVLAAIESLDREFVCINCPPGSGKSTLFTHDIPAWLIARDRSIRLQIGSATGTQARWYVGRLKKTLEREVPLQADAKDVELGAAYDAIACLATDFGSFKPPGRTDLWRADALVVTQYGGAALDDKEPTVSGWGQDSSFLGGRFDLILWDDLVNRKNSTGEARDKLCDWWVTEAESRLEPRGVMVLQGQRIESDDLYRFVLGLTDLDGEPKYRHIVYPAHDEERCQGRHDKAAGYYPAGCLLDPYRLPWRYLSNIAENTKRVYEISYQQRDGSAAGALVRKVWIEGGMDSEGDHRPGCLDLDRVFGQSFAPPRQGWSLVSVDPSPSNFWGVMHWVIRPSGQPPVFEVTSLWRRRMGNEDFLSMDLDTKQFSGLLEDIRVEQAKRAHPLHAVVVEVNAAQKWLLGQAYVRHWAALYSIRLIPHSTGVNKLDPEFGVRSTADFYRQGKVRLPYGDQDARRSVGQLIHELTTWPDGLTDDLVMSAWFALRAAQVTYIDPAQPPPRFTRPSWLSKARSLAEVYGGGGA